MITSVDIFDTVLTRMVGRPDSLFILLGNRLCRYGLVSVSPEVFARNRCIAEELIRRDTPKGDPTLTQIYENLGWTLGWSSGIAQLCMNEELALEAELIRPMPGGQELVRELEECANDTVFLSDMYLPSRFLGARLSSLLGVPTPVEVLVSCECGATKASGELFRHLVAEKRVKPSEVLHVGNDVHADGVMATRMGVATRLITDATLNRYEVILENHRWETMGATSVLAGTSRMTRLSSPPGNSRDRVMHEVAAGVVAPTLVAYVLWVLKRARDLKLDRLYFVSRDGEILFEIAKALARKYEIGVELRYLYGSRQAWHLPAFGLFRQQEQEEEWLFENTDRLSIKMVLAKVGLQPSDFERVLLDNGFPMATWESDLNRLQREALREVFRSSEVRFRIMRSATEARALMLAYLAQESMLDNARKGIVDLGWTGRMFDSLWGVLRSVNVESPYGLMFGHYGVAGSEKFAPKEGYFLDQALRRGSCSLKTGLLEAFCTGTHGMVSGYKDDAGFILPVLDRPVNQEALDWGLLNIRTAVSSFVDNLSTAAEHCGLTANLRPAVEDLLSTLWYSPTQPEAAAFGSYLHYDIQTESYGLPFAVPLRARDILDRLLRKRSLRHSSRGHWHAASVRLTPKNILFLVQAAKMIRATFSRLVFSLRRLSAESRKFGPAN